LHGNVVSLQRYKLFRARLAFRAFRSNQGRLNTFLPRLSKIVIFIQQNGYLDAEDANIDNIVFDY